LPPGDWNEISKAYKKTGNWGDISPAHSTNMVLAVLRPDRGDEGRVALCHGPAKRGMAPFAPTQVIAMRGETNAFWELHLGANPQEVTEGACEKARAYIEQARREVTHLNTWDAAYTPLQALLKQAEQEFTGGSEVLKEATSENGNACLYDLSKSTRLFTRAQVRALQAYQALVPPASKPEELIDSSGI
jgi:hypothetical protein